MSADPLRLDDLLESVADGTSVDWDALEAQADPEQQRLLRNLRLVAGIADVHRTIAFEESSVSPAPRQPDVVPRVEGERRWGHLLLIEKVAEGAFGEVYRARDPWLDREVALKLLKPAVATRVPGTRIVEEARTLARVRHPNVVTVYGADMHDGRVGLWMEFVHGRTLAQIVATEGPFSAAEAAVIGQEVCRALAAVHAAGLVHRDVKAQNVMRESGGRLALMDFGAGHTPLYLAPELLSGGEATVRSDVYALGVLLYFLATGAYPVTGSSSNDLEKAHALGRRRRLADVRPDLPDNFVAAVEHAIDSDPALRFSTAALLQDALAEVGRRHERVSSGELRKRLWSWILPVVAALVVGVAAGLVYWRLRQPGPSVPYAAVQMIAVLPLQPLGGADRYVADGLTEALMQELSTAGPLKVTSRTSVDRLVSAGTPLPQLASVLDVDAVVEGSVLRSGERLEVNVRVIHAGTDTAVWARSFERVAADLLVMQRDIARAVAAELRLALYPRTVERWQNPRAVAVGAYDEYLRGRHEFRRQTQASVEEALKHFQRAVAIDSGYARAYVGIAECYRMLGNEFRVLPAAEGARLARDAVERALKLDDTLADARSVLADISFEYDWNFKAAEDHFRHAIRLDPSLVAPRESYAMFLASRGRFPEAFEQLAAARAVDPLSSSLADRTAAAYYYARQFDQALAEVERAITLDPTGMSPQVGRGRILNAMGRHDEAIAQYGRTAQASSNHPFFLAEIAQAETARSEQVQAETSPDSDAAERARVVPLDSLIAQRVALPTARIRALEELMRMPSSRVSPQMMALAYARVNRDVAFQWLERAFVEKAGGVLFLKVDPRFDPFRGDARFRGYLTRLELEP